MVLRQFLEYKHREDDQTIEPMMVRGTVPLCMEQHRRMFSTTRIPGRESDTNVHLDGIDEKRHVVVMCKGTYYRLDCYQSGPIVSQATLLTAKQLEHRLNIISEDGGDCARDITNKAAGKISSLTTMNRTRWAELREDHLSFGLNRVSLSVIECVLCPFPYSLGCCLPSSFSPWRFAVLASSASTLAVTPRCRPLLIPLPLSPSPFAAHCRCRSRPTAQDRDDGRRALGRKAVQQRRDGEALAGASRGVSHRRGVGGGVGHTLSTHHPPTAHLLGSFRSLVACSQSGSNIWYDKSMNLMAFDNGRIGLNAEHSWADALVIGHLFETCVFIDASPDLGAGYDETGSCKPADDEPVDPTLYVHLNRSSFDSPRCFVRRSPRV